MLELIKPSVLNGTYTNALPDYNIWDAGTSYTAGQYVSYLGRNYRCKVANSGRSPKVYSGGKFVTTWTNPSSYSIWDSSVTYNSGDIELFYTTTKSIYYEPDVEVVKNGISSYYYVVRALSTTTESPSKLLNTNLSSNWEFVGFEWTSVGLDNTNVFYGDNITISGTSKYAGTMVCKFDTDKNTSVALLNVEGSKITVSVKDKTTDDVLWTSTVSGLYLAEISNWYEYFTYVPSFLGNFIFDFDRYDNSYVEINITPPTDGISKCSLIIAGTKSQFGDILFSPTYTLEDYSKKQPDDNGYITLIEGAFRDKLDLSMIFPVGRTDYVITIFKKYRAIPAVWIVDKNYSNGIVYGFFSDFNTEFITNKTARSTLTLESL